MSTLNDKQINQAYKGLVHTSDHDVIGTTKKRLQDGEGNNLPVEVGTTGMKYYGTQDFTSATVTGISGGGGGGATYDLTSAQNGDAIDIVLTGSDLSVDTVQIQPGTNITLTETATNVFTIDAAGGGGETYLQDLFVAYGSRITSSGDNYTAVSNITYLYPMWLTAGMNLRAFGIGISTVFGATTTLDVHLFDSQYRSPWTFATHYPKTRLQTLTTGFPLNTQFLNEVAFTTYTVQNTGLYYVALQFQGDPATGTFYRASNSLSDSVLSPFYKVGMSSPSSATASMTEKHYYVGALPDTFTSVPPATVNTPWFYLKYN